MTVIGSVFLGDAVRHRALQSLSTPPSSPPGLSPQWSPSKSGSSTGTREHAPISPLNMEHIIEPSNPSPQPAHIDPELSVELRVRWLEALLLGVKNDGKGKIVSKGKTQEGQQIVLTKEAERLQRRLNELLENNDSLRKFIERYPRYAPYLSPTFALPDASPSPSYASMSSDEFDALLAEMEPEIKSAEGDLRAIDALEQRDVLSAGKLTEYEPLLPRLEKLVKLHQEDLQTAAALEKRVASILERYTTQVDALSELFVDWNAALTTAEDKVSKTEREREKAKRTGFE